MQVQVAQHHGGGRLGAVTRVVRTGLLASLAAGTVVGAALSALAPGILALLGGSAELIGDGTSYLRVLACAVRFAAASFTLQGACAGIGATRVSMSLASGFHRTAGRE
ncbi:hypothetical protein K8Z49_22600 [Actinomadura madurae]|uniref:MATE family efflux transporter n=1 Tax=Actinomadura madurae TaxID=1993 RepID=UPI00399B8945